MAKLQVSRTEAIRAAVQLEIARTEVTVPSVTGTRRLQISRVEAGTNISTAPVITSATVSATKVEPFDQVDMVLTISGSYNQVVWSQQATGGPTVALFGSDLAKSYIAPADVVGADVRFVATATGPGGTSDPASFRVIVGPQVEWFLPASGPWAPLVSTQIVA